MDDLKPIIGNQGLITVSLRAGEWLKFIFVLLIVIEVFLTCCNIANSFDLPWQLSEGELILDHGYPAKSVLQAYGEISPHFQNEYILYESLISGINRITGWTGLCVFFSVVSFLIYLPCLLAFLRSRYRFTFIDICLFMLAQFLIDIRLIARPELVADVCYVFAGILLMQWPWRSWNGPKTLAFGTIFCLWSNAHGSFLLGGAMLAFWYAQLLLFQWRSLLIAKDFTWLRPGLAALIGCAVNPFGFYRFTQPFELHGLLWGQATSLEMWPVTSGAMLLPLTWTIAAILILIMRIRDRKYYWIIAMLLLLQYLTFCSFRYNLFIGLTLLIITWDGLVHPREPFAPPIFPLFFSLARSCLYLYLVVAYLNLNYSLVYSKLDIFHDYIHFVYPKSRIITTSSFGWLREHPNQSYTLLSSLAAGSWAQMPGTDGIHPLIDTGSHRYSDRTNQLYYYSHFSPETFRLVISQLDINAITTSSKDVYWASALNADPHWYLAHIESDSQLYLHRDDLSHDADPHLFSKWEEGVHREELKTAIPGKPIEFSSERIMRGLKIRPDAESLLMLLTASDTYWVEDPQLVYLKDWLAQVPDDLIEDALTKLGGKMDNTSAALRILLLLRLQHTQPAMEIAEKWHPAIFDMGYQDLQMLRVEAFVRGGDPKSARRILDFFWPKPRYSLRWAELCEQVYANDPNAIPQDARLLTEMAHQIKWQEDTIAALNGNILRLSMLKKNIDR